MFRQFLLNHNLNVPNFPNLSYLFCVVQHTYRASWRVGRNWNSNKVKILIEQILAISSSWHPITDHNELCDVLGRSSPQNDALTPSGTVGTVSHYSFIWEAAVRTGWFGWIWLETVVCVVLSGFFELFWVFQGFLGSKSFKDFDGLHISCYSFLSDNSVLA